MCRRASLALVLALAALLLAASASASVQQAAHAGNVAHHRRVCVRKSCIQRVQGRCRRYRCSACRAGAGGGREQEGGRRSVCRCCYSRRSTELRCQSLDAAASPPAAAQFKFAHDHRRRSRRGRG